MEQEREAQRRQIIEEERQRLLKQHATKLLGYLPKVRTPQHIIPHILFNGCDCSNSFLSGFVVIHHWYNLCFFRVFSKRMI